MLRLFLLQGGNNRKTSFLSGLFLVDPAKYRERAGFAETVEDGEGEVAPGRRVPRVRALAAASTASGQKA